MKSSRLMCGVVCLWAAARTVSAADAAADTSTESSATTLQEVVVTAQKREERLEDVPIAMSVLEGRDLTTRNLTQLTDYADYLPGVNVTDNGTPGFTAITIGVLPTLGQPQLLEPISMMSPLAQVLVGLSPRRRSWTYLRTIWIGLRYCVALKGHCTGPVARAASLSMCSGLLRPLASTVRLALTLTGLTGETNRGRGSGRS